MSLLDNFKLTLSSEREAGFPASFQVAFDHQQNSELNGFAAEFVKVKSGNSKDVYLIDEKTGQPVKSEIHTQATVTL